MKKIVLSSLLMGVSFICSAWCTTTTERVRISTGGCSDAGYCATSGYYYVYYNVETCYTWYGSVKSTSRYRISERSDY